MRYVRRIVLLLITIMMMSGCGTPKLEENQYIVKFDMNGGKGKVEKVIATYEEGMPNINILPTKKNYGFMGFYDKRDYRKGQQYYNEYGENTKAYDKKKGTTLYAGWGKLKFKLKIDLNGGEGTTKEYNAEYGKELPKIEVIPVRSKYTFKGWYDNENYTEGTQYYDEGNNPVKICDKYGEMTLYAGWEYDGYKISFDANGGNGGQSGTKEALYNKELPKISTIKPTRKGYTFTGWYDSDDYKDGQEYYGSDCKSTKIFEVREDVTLYAGWEVNTYVVSFKANGGIGGQSESIEVKYGYSMPDISSAKPTRTNYVFTGWYDSTNYKMGTMYYDENGKGVEEYDKIKNITLYAGWEKKGNAITPQNPGNKETKYTVSFNANGGIGGQSTSVKVANGKEMPKISSTKPTRSGYQFMGWYDNKDYTKGNKYYTAGGNSARAYDKRSSTTLYAGWRKTNEGPVDGNTYAVAFDANGGSGGQRLAVEATYNEVMPKISAIKPTRSGYTFKGWYDNKDYTIGKQYYGADCKSSVKYDLNSEIVLYAGWEGNTYKISFKPNGGSGGQSESVEVKYGGVLPTISGEKPIKTNYTFMGWYNSTNYLYGTMYYDSEGRGVKEYDKTSNITLYAGWAKAGEEDKKYTISFKPNGGSGGQSESVEVRYGGVLPTISSEKPTRKGYVFMGWYDSTNYKSGTQYYDENCIGKIVYTKKKNITLFAGWAKEEVKKYKVTFDANGGTGGQSGSKDATYGSKMPAINRTSPTKAGYTFMGWYDNQDYTKGTQYYTSSGSSTVIFDKTNDITLYAGWKLNVLSIKYNGNHGTWVADNDKYFADVSGTVIEKGINVTYYQKLNYGESLDSSGLMNYNGKWFKWERENYKVESKKEYYLIGGSTKTIINQDKAYSAVDLAKFGGCDLTKRDCTVTVYVNWIKDGSSDPTPEDNGVLKIYYMGLGRYDGHLIVGNNTALFIDGGFQSQADKAITIMKSLGITKLDGLIGSHLHNNHIEGHNKIIKEMEVKRVYYGEDPSTCIANKTCRQASSDPTKLMALIKEKNIPMTILKPGLNISIGNLKFDIVAPASLSTSGGYPENNNSLNMILKFGKTKFYFSGDHVRSDEIMKNYSADILSVDVFKYPHHGQEYVSPDFINLLKPKYVMVPNTSNAIPSGSMNAFNKLNAQVFVLGSSGYVLVESDGKTVTATKH